MTTKDITEDITKEIRKEMKEKERKFIEHLKRTIENLADLRSDLILMHKDVKYVDSALEYFRNFLARIEEKNQSYGNAEQKSNEEA